MALTLWTLFILILSYLFQLPDLTILNIWQVYLIIIYINRKLFLLLIKLRY